MLFTSYRLLSFGESIMNVLLKSALLTSSLSLLPLVTSIASADEDDFERGYAKGLHALEDRMNYKLGGVNDAIDENTAAIGANTAAINTNATAIGENSSAIGAANAAVDVNATAITALQAGEPTYDYREFAAAANITGKTYNIRNIATCDKETRLFSRETTGDSTDITMTRVRTENGAACRYHVFTFRNAPEGRYRLGTDSYNRSGTVLGGILTLDKPALIRSSNMKIGNSIADATSTTLTDTLGNTLSQGTYVQTTLLAGIESVTVPYNGGTTFDGCMKLHIIHNASISFGTGMLDRVQWNCPGVGMVKRIQGNGGYYELTDVTYAP